MTLSSLIPIHRASLSRMLMTTGFLIVGLLFSSRAIAEVKLSALFSDGMVLQRDKPVSVWGAAASGEAVTVAVAGQKQTVTADADGKWLVKLDPLKAGGPHSMKVTGSNEIVISDLLIGEVWLCSGQSNMAMAVNGVTNAEEEIASAVLFAASDEAGYMNGSSIVIDGGMSI